LVQAAPSAAITFTAYEAILVWLMTMQQQQQQQPEAYSSGISSSSRGGKGGL
jgi:hypothetical protein